VKGHGYIYGSSSILPNFLPEKPQQGIFPPVACDPNASFLIVTDEGDRPGTMLWKDNVRG
jgi:hypothetical protein